MMQYCKLKSDVKVCSIYPLGVEDCYILLNERANGIVDILHIDGCESYPIKYTSTWAKNIIPFDSEKNAIYNDVDRPNIVFIDKNKIKLNYRDKLYEFFYDKNDMVFSKNSLVKIIDPTNQFNQEEGMIIALIDEEEWLVTHDFIPRYELKLNSGKTLFVDHYQIEMIKH
jgi:hypothetical protein